jgi:hypothetical protein
MTTDEIAAGIKTNRQGRAILGVVADYLKRGYELVPKLGTYKESIFNIFVPDDDLQEDARDLLDATNNYSIVLYNSLPDNDGPIDENRRRQIGVALNQAQSSFTLLARIDADLSSSFIEDLADVLAGGLTAIVGTATRALTSNWQTVALVGGAVWVAMMFVRRRR